eukprot:TRINITY_DN10723_c0_g2_i1.p1 TRINITY_DN10723_c0_g2~~TRINITY_DN10723_c0_g2_i1.p1  ORF type:complete len:1332 (-),score=209.91 TRINITY_DN10723_c0_g2_i1:34-4029(-)
MRVPSSMPSPYTPQEDFSPMNQPSPCPSFSDGDVPMDRQVSAASQRSVAESVTFSSGRLRESVFGSAARVSRRLSRSAMLSAAAAAVRNQAQKVTTGIGSRIQARRFSVDAAVSIEELQDSNIGVVFCTRVKVVNCDMEELKRRKKEAMRSSEASDDDDDDCDDGSESDQTIFGNPAWELDEEALAAYERRRRQLRAFVASGHSFITSMQNQSNSLLVRMITNPLASIWGEPILHPKHETIYGYSARLRLPRFSSSSRIARCFQVWLKASAFISCAFVLAGLALEAACVPPSTGSALDRLKKPLTSSNGELGDGFFGLLVFLHLVNATLYTLLCFTVRVAVGRLDLRTSEEIQSSSAAVWSFARSIGFWLDCFAVPGLIAEIVHFQEQPLDGTPSASQCMMLLQLAKGWRFTLLDGQPTRGSGNLWHGICSILLSLALFAHACAAALVVVGQQERAWSKPSWLEQFPKEISCGDLYIESMYFATLSATSVGYGDLMMTSRERTVNAAEMLLGYILTAKLCSDITWLTSTHGLWQAHIQAIRAQTRLALQQMKVPQVLADRVLAYQSYVATVHSESMAQSMFDGLSENLDAELRLSSRRGLVMQAPFLREQCKEVIVFMVGALRDQINLPADFIVVAGDSGRDLYFMCRGRANVFLNVSEPPVFGSTTEVATYSEGAYFGELSMLTGCKRSAWIMARTYCVCSVLPYAAITHLSDKIPKAFTRIVQAMVAGYKLTSQTTWSDIVQRMIERGIVSVGLAFEWFLTHNEVEEDEELSAKGFDESMLRLKVPEIDRRIMWAELDSDNSGTVAFDEFAAAMQTIFDEMPAFKVPSAGGGLAFGLARSNGSQSSSRRASSCGNRSPFHKRSRLLVRRRLSHRTSLVSKDGSTTRSQLRPSVFDCTVASAPCEEGASFRTDDGAPVHLEDEPGDVGGTVEGRRSFLHRAAKAAASTLAVMPSPAGFRKSSCSMDSSSAESCDGNFLSVVAAPVAAGCGRRTQERSVSPTSSSPRSRRTLVGTQDGENSPTRACSWKIRPSVIRANDIERSPVPSCSPLIRYSLAGATATAQDGDVSLAPAVVNRAARMRLSMKAAATVVAQERETSPTSSPSRIRQSLLGAAAVMAAAGESCNTRGCISVYGASGCAASDNTAKSGIGRDEGTVESGGTVAFNEEAKRLLRGITDGLTKIERLRKFAATVGQHKSRKRTVPPGRNNALASRALSMPPPHTRQQRRRHQLQRLQCLLQSPLQRPGQQKLRQQQKPLLLVQPQVHLQLQLSEHERQWQPHQPQHQQQKQQDKHEGSPSAAVALLRSRPVGTGPSRRHGSWPKSKKDNRFK